MTRTDAVTGPISDPLADPPVTHLLYLHGFRSSPQSAKARQMAARVAAEHPAVTWWCPQLPPSPAAAMALLWQGLAAWPAESMAVVGSSLGGFYATCVAARFRCRLVVLNPSVHPARSLARHIGEHPQWHDPAQSLFFAPEYVDELRLLEREAAASPLDAARTYALIAQGDEVLDWREMVGRYPGAAGRVLDGGDHALSDFADHMDGVLAFLRLA